MASSHIARITAGGVSDRRIAHSLYGVCNTAADTVAKTVSLYTGSSTTTDGTWAAADLFHGLTVKVRFVNSNSASNPTLNVNGTGAKPIYRYGTTKATSAVINSWTAGEIITFTYDTLLNSSGCWVIDHGYRLGNDNTYDRIFLNSNAIKAASTAIVAANIIVADSDGLYKHLNNGTAFDITYPILYANSAISANSTSSSAYIDIPFSITTTQSMTLTPHKAIYIKGRLDGVDFTPVSTAPLTQAIPSTADTYQYMLLGYARSASPNAYLLRDHPIYEFSGGKFHLYGGGSGVYHTTITKTANSSTNTFSVNHYLNTKNVMVSVVINDGIYQYLIQPNSFATSAGIAYCTKIVNENGVNLIFNPNSDWTALAGNIKVSIITTDTFTADPASVNDILIKVN